MKKVFLLILALLLFPLVSAKYINYSFIPYPNNFDYRDFMGENWMTPIRDQDGCGSCWAHAAVGAVEGVINLYYNQHLNVDLSEQQLVSCPGWGGNCLGGLYWMALGSMISNFVVDEECFSYQASNVPCDICENPEKTWLLSSLSSVYFVPQFYINWLKGKLFENGPGAMEVVSWNHAIVFAGFDENNKIIIKNSWGDDWGDNGYGVLEYDYYDMGFVFPVAPFSSPSTNVFCSDNDNDGYCYWGKNDLPKPKNCPQTCHTNSDIDFDDADEAIGPLRNVWIKNLQYDDTIKFGESGDITVVVALDGESDFFVEDVFVNFYLNDKLVESVSVSIGSNEMKTVVFSHFFDKLTNNYFKIEVDSIPQESQMFLDDNIVEGEMWVYNYDSGFVFSYKDNYTLFDCSTNENPSGMPIKGIIGPKLTTDSGILIYGKQDFQIKNCLIAGWSNGVNIHYSDSSLVSNNIIINNNKGIYLQSNSDENIVVDNELSNNIIGIGLQNSAHNNISSNVIYNTNYEGIELDRSSNNELYNNIIDDYDYGIVLKSTSFDNFLNKNIVCSNSGKTKVDLFCEGGTISSSTTRNLLNTQKGCGLVYGKHYLYCDASWDVQTIHLQKGWNLFSSYLIPKNPDMLAVLQPLIDAGVLIKVQADNGFAVEFLPSPVNRWINEIGDFSPTEGYDIKVSSDVDLIIEGSIAQLPFVIDLNTGWNFIGFPNVMRDGLEVVLPLIDAGILVKVQDEKGNTIEYLPQPINQWINRIGDFYPGEGYKINVKTNSELIIS